MEKGAYIVSANPERKGEIKFSINPHFTDEVPEVQQKMHLEIEKTLAVIRHLFGENSPSFEIYFDQILKLAQAGLVGDNAHPEISLKALDQLKNEIVDTKSGEVKNKYFKNLGVTALYSGLIPIILGLVIISFNFYLPQSNFFKLISPFANYLFLWSACMLGVWLSFGARKTVLKFEELNILEEDRLEPGMRLLFTGFIAIVFGFLFDYDIVTIDIGQFSSNLISEDPVVAIILGVFIGLSDQIIGKKISKKATSAFNSI